MQAGAKLVLIVDDEPDIRIFLADLLTTQGFGCASADNGQDAVHQIDPLQPDLVLLDIMMPGMSGIEVLRHIREQHGNTTRVIMLSCLSHPNTTLRALDEGADHFVVKPFRVSESAADDSSGCSNHAARRRRRADRPDVTLVDARLVEAARRRREASPCARYLRRRARRRSSAGIASISRSPPRPGATTTFAVARWCLCAPLRGSGTIPSITPSSRIRAQ